MNLQSQIQTFRETSLDAQEQLGLHTWENMFGEDVLHNSCEVAVIPSCGRATCWESHTLLSATEMETLQVTIYSST